MIGQDRLELNNRFIEVFGLLEERGDIVKNDRGGKGMGDFAEKILGNRAYGHIVRAFLNEGDRRVIDYRHARALCHSYGVNESYMIDGIGSPFGMDLPASSPENTASNYKGNILFTTTEAFAGSAVDVGSATEESTEYFSMPGLFGSGLVAFPIKGNSMEPVVMNGDIVICREIGLLNEIKDNKIYAVKTSGSVWIKYVQKVPDRAGRIRNLKLISANHLEHDPFVEEVNEHTRLYQVVRKISDL